ncbi:MAG: hypothetical protein ACRDHY_19485 [Anaerolineales bacterium]
MIPVRTLVLIALLTLNAPLWATVPEEAPSVGSTVVGSGIIVPGKQVGPLRLSMPLPQILEAVGPGYKREEFKAEKIILYEWRAQAIWVSQDLVSKEIRVISAFGTNSKYRTDKGVALLDAFTKAEGIYGKGYRRWEYKKEKLTLIRYAALGLQFGVVDDPGQPLLNGRIFQIGVFLPGNLPPVRQP